MSLYGADTMRKQAVTLSDGTRCQVSIGSASHCYYPDLPHCCVCEVSQYDAPLVTCDTPLRGKHGGICGATVCLAHRVRQGPYDYCPRHTHRDEASPAPEGGPHAARRQ